MDALRIMIADDHTLVRKGFRAILEAMDGIEVVAEVGDGREALECIKMQPPDILLLDVAMPGINGLQVLSQVSRTCPDVKVIILSMHANEEYVSQSLRHGAAGYLLKDADVSEMEIAIRAVARGEMYLSPAISRQVVESYILRTHDVDDAPRVALTSRQLQVLRLIGDGCTTQQIAQSLDISVKTVESHRAQIMERLGIHSVAGLIRYALLTGLASPRT